ncbi:hypothetical protein [Enterobacter cloacae complex sp. 357B1]|uniref:hypothetical protein n=1 Tax=Enterobacter cloacae complex sp. 357B1 TaxID=3395827 RepID=UPI003CE95A72
MEQLRDFDIDINNIPNDCVGVGYAVDQQLDCLECTLVGISEKNYYVLIIVAFLPWIVINMTHQLMQNYKIS